MSVLPVKIAHSILATRCLSAESANLFDNTCLTLYLSKFVGYSMIIVSFFLKLPQILKIIKADSAKGISLTTFYMDTLSYSLMSAYCIHKVQPISTYGEHISVLVQCLILVVLYWKVERIDYQTRIQASLMFIAGMYLLLNSKVITEEMWSLTPLVYTLLSITGKLTQIQENFVNKSTGNLSFFTNFVTFLGSVSRVFTTLTELDDQSLLFSYLIGGILKGIIVFQFLTYNKPKLD